MLVESGAYVLGALSPAGRQTYEQHLSTCAECRAEVGDLAVLPGLLGRLDAASVDTDETVTAPPAVLPGVIARVQRRRRNRRFLAIAGAVAAACLALVVGLTVPTHTTPPANQAGPSVSAPAAVLHPMKSVGSANMVTAKVGLASFSGGTRIVGTCTYAGNRYNYSGPINFVLYVYSKTGEREEVESWSALPGDTVPIATSTWMPMNDMSKIELVGPAGTQLSYTVA